MALVVTNYDSFLLCHLADIFFTMSVAAKELKFCGITLQGNQT